MPIASPAALPRASAIGDRLDAIKFKTCARMEPEGAHGVDTSMSIIAGARSSFLTAESCCCATENGGCAKGVLVPIDCFNL